LLRFHGIYIGIISLMADLQTGQCFGTGIAS